MFRNDFFFPLRQMYLFKFIPTETIETSGTAPNMLLDVFNEQRGKQIFLFLLFVAFVYK